MEISVTTEERERLEHALRETRRVREWRRYRAVLLAAEGESARAIAETLRVSEASVSNWVAAWRRRGHPPGVLGRRGDGRQPRRSRSPDLRRAERCGAGHHVVEMRQEHADLEGTAMSSSHVGSS